MNFLDCIETCCLRRTGLNDLKISSDQSTREASNVLADDAGAFSAQISLHLVSKCLSGIALQLCGAGCASICSLRSCTQLTSWKPHSCFYG